MKAYNFNKSNTPPWVFLTFFKLYQMVPNSATRHLFSKMVNKPMFPFHNPSKNANDVVLVFLSLTLNMFTTFCTVYIVDFEQVNVSWDVACIVHRPANS